MLFAVSGHASAILRRLLLHRVSSKRPVEGVAVNVIPTLDERHHPLLQVSCGMKIAPLENPLLQNGEEDLHLIHPRRMDGGVEPLSTRSEKPIPPLPHGLHRGLKRVGSSLFGGAFFE